MIEAIEEVERRALAWTAGPTVILADGSVWFFPRLDLALLATQPELIDELRQLLTLERALTRLEPGSIRRDEQAHDRLTVYHAFARRLLALNYDLTDDEWLEVLPNSHEPWFLNLVCHLGDALILAVLDDWRGLAVPFLGATSNTVLSN